MRSDRPSVTLSPLGGVAEVLRVAWEASPSLLLWQAMIAVVAGLVPTIAAWINRAVLNAVVGDYGQKGNVGPTAHRSVLVLALALGTTGLIVAIIPHVTRYVTAAFKRKTDLLIQDRLCRTMNSFPGLSRFETPEFKDEVRLALDEGSTAPGQFLTNGFGALQALISGGTFIAALALINTDFILLIVGAAIPAVTAQLITSRRRMGVLWTLSPSMRRRLFYRGLQFDLNAAKEVRLFGLSDFLRTRMLDEQRTINNAEERSDRTVVSVQGSLAVLAACITGVGLIWVVNQAARGRVSVGDVTLFVMAIGGVQTAMASLIASLIGGYEALTRVGYYRRIIGAGPDLPIAEKCSPVPRLDRGVEFRNVWFRYDERQPWVLKGASLFLPAGRTVGLVGRNGAGKSTLIKLLCRFYDPSKGSIFWDGVDLRDINPADLRQRIGAVFQDYMAYDLTAVENIGMGDLKRLRNSEETKKAAEQAGIHARLSSLPRGYDTLLSRIFIDSDDEADPQTGSTLSGGEWQRLAVARGLMRHDRDLLILDEPSSGLDAEAEHAIHARLRSVRQGRASLLITHRLSAVREADTIVVLADGKVVEQGTHLELMAAKGAYCRLFSLQAAGYRDGPITTVEDAPLGQSAETRVGTLSEAPL